MRKHYLQGSSCALDLLESVECQEVRTIAIIQRKSIHIGRRLILVLTIVCVQLEVEAVQAASDHELELSVVGWDHSDVHVDDEVAGSICLLSHESAVHDVEAGGGFPVQLACEDDWNVLEATPEEELLELGSTQEEDEDDVHADEVEVDAGVSEEDPEAPVEPEPVSVATEDVTVALAKVSLLPGASVLELWVA
jgi:hypothetical protein